MCGTEGDRELIERYNLGFRAKPYKKFYFAKDAAVWKNELDFERRQRTNSKWCRILSLQSLEVHALPRRVVSDLYAAVPECWSQYETHRALGVPRPGMYSYLTDVHGNGSAAPLSVSRIVEAINVLPWHLARSCGRYSFAWLVFLLTIK